MAKPALTQEHAGSRRRLPGLNFFLADVRDGLGPFLGVLLLGQGWRADDIGYVMTAGGIAGMLATAPMGAWVDASRHKRLLLALGIGALTVATLALWHSPSFGVVLVSQLVTGVVGALLGACVMGITLGLADPRHLSQQLGINEAWSHAGNMTAAALAGLAGYRWGISAVLLLMTMMACASLICLRSIRPQDIDHERARGLGPASASGGIPRVPTSTLQRLSHAGELGLLAATMLLFHLGNAAMLPLFAQAMVTRTGIDPSAFTASTVIVAQLVMIPMALWAGRFASHHGYRPLVMAALMVLPVRGLVAGFWDSPWAVIPVQALDGVGAGLLGIALPGLVSSILRGTGHINAGLGAVMSIQGLGAALSPALAGAIAQHYGYSTAFASLGLIATAALITYCIGSRWMAPPFPSPCGPGTSGAAPEGGDTPGQETAAIGPQSSDPALAVK
ncbi:MAG: MFS transporter [Comamonas sp.]|jgi:predicted MFS family arabinose efflux permease|uniref:MFS transporter n=1 Tax=Comamonas sp. TaxID=34028 RepID=UPI0028424197|nr:MFS transporter [Comamonas sp.]MDR3067653.1 MFS transporter [Comamonas sp.]